MKIGNNQPCPCGSSKKYKRCCRGRVDWDALSRDPTAEYARHLTLRGKNLNFINSILGALQVNTLSPNFDWAQLKRAFTPNAVTKIHNAVVDLWPDLTDYEACATQASKDVTALYTGTYEPDAIFRAVGRHALYSERIYLVDPFLDPRMLRDEFNPLLHPEEHRANTIKYAFLWLSLFPWIEAGIVGFIRPLTDFVPDLKPKLLEIGRRRASENQELAKLLDQEVDEVAELMGPTDRGMGEYHFLCESDDFFRKLFRKLGQDSKIKTEEDFIRYIHYRRDTHPFYLDQLPGQTSELIYETSGASYELAKAMCAFTNSHMVTDMKYRWKEIEVDRPKASTEERSWEPFAKALQATELKILSRVELPTVLRLRRENRLETMRLFFSKVWKSCREPNPFAEENAISLAAELHDKVAEAESEWKRIDLDLVKWVGTSGSAIAAGAVAGIVPAVSAAAGGAVAGAASLIHAHLKRSNLKDRYPAAFFLGPK